MEPMIPAAITTLEKITIPEVLDIEAIRTVIGPSIDRALDQAAKIAVSIVDDATRDLAIDAAENLQGNAIDILEKLREDHYIPKYRDAEDTRELFDPRLKKAKAAKKTMLAGVSDYKVRKDREAALARERAEAEARRAREELERKQRELEESERRRKAAEEAEVARKKELEESERRRIVAEKELQERKEREAREAAAAETRRRMKEEEDARLEQARVAQEVGNGAAKVDTILESATPIAPVLGKAEQAPDQETVRLENEQAARVAAEKIEREKAAQAEAERLRVEAEAETERKRQEVLTATAAVTSAAAAAASTQIATTPDSRTTSVTRWKYDLDSDGTEAGDIAAVMVLLKAIVEGRAPITYCGYDPKHPERFRPSQIGEDVTVLKDRFACPGLRAYPQQDEQLKRRAVGGRR